MAQRKRQALSEVGGPVRTVGDRDRARLLAHAFEATESMDPDVLTHGFHAYPARMHPAIARVLVSEVTGEGGVVFDPFCGSGTVLVEAVAGGRRSLGVDLNPIAVRVAEVKCALRSEASRRRFLETLVRVGQLSEERVRGRVKVHAPLPPEEARWWDPHVLKELAGLREEILLVEEEEDRRALLVLLSAIVVKFSRQRADTAEQQAPKRIRKGLSTEFFVRRGRELADRWAELREVAPPDAREPLVIEGDARRLPDLAPRRARAHLVLTSPPYGGTYDYFQHHVRRYRWLDVDPSVFGRGELGARRHLQAPEDADRWDRELGQALQAMARVCRPGAAVILLIGDAQLGRRRIDAETQVARLAPAAGLTPMAAASQPRRDRRREHLLWLERSR